ncbi:hypothetical protein PQ478_09250 [Alkalihalophilus pseudofirmus]|uniref:hypothetical protein n=1 Tax=Alkalihalophilus pseudofirmus TaxID=79885 RepID=UPI00259B75D4|nr:hypothetical protein [Alkalihalophilus pseudofirmus]WEG18655.1 hypothetical protein PQ478_09250 [Alkalihalophilus pseudofirmus]
MKSDPITKHRTDLITYHIQTNESMHLSEKSLHDIHSNVNEAVQFWRKRADKYFEDNHALRWNELKLWIKRNKNDGNYTYEELADVIARLDRKESVR